jgi:hypothetical protein
LFNGGDQEKRSSLRNHAIDTFRSNNFNMYIYTYKHLDFEHIFYIKSTMILMSIIIVLYIHTHTSK